eukprot:gene7311-6883_t
MCKGDLAAKAVGDGEGMHPWDITPERDAQMLRDVRKRLPQECFETRPLKSIYYCFRDWLSIAAIIWCMVGLEEYNPTAWWCLLPLSVFAQ